jgi:hypothetical protein
MTVRDNINQTRARTPGAEGDPPSTAVHDRVLGPTLGGTPKMTTKCTNGGRKPNMSQCMPGAGLSWLMCGKAPPEMPAFQPYRGQELVKLAREQADVLAFADRNREIVELPSGLETGKVKHRKPLRVSSLEPPGNSTISRFLSANASALFRCIPANL